MKERPVLFNAPMVRALLAGTKTQTRRVVKIPHLEFSAGHLADLNDPRNWGYECDDGWMKLKASADPRDDEMQIQCPYGQHGDRLWVREMWMKIPRLTVDGMPMDDLAKYRSTDEVECAGKYSHRWRPSIHMPRWASRITLEIIGVRVERLNDISFSDAKAEGVESVPLPVGVGSADSVTRYRWLWESINGPGSWDVNPWAWVVEFKRWDPATLEVGP